MEVFVILNESDEDLYVNVTQGDITYNTTIKAHSSLSLPASEPTTLVKVLGEGRAS